ncbi:formate dehydrogenase subunit delta [Pseudomonas cremoricolorata]|uniref:Formate dehydrogenase n=1 Tax=Pseudomonas cremoricolorata TaxID=157783 RepID=A0A089WUU7_9PSED|nr:formate dehydrogenase subunit delta [Pseudomonas cremoricolorata]AIR90337.1 formate dehydrogenase [Pseudomonas cremoricolorata]
MSTHDNLVKMANHIAHYFDSEPDRELAVQGLNQHLRSFWTPAMLKQLSEKAKGEAANDLDPLVLRALHSA